MSGIDWTQCVICQKNTAEDLRSPTVNHLAVYNAFVTNYKEFKRLDSLPVQMKFDGDGSTLMQYQAKWHKFCHQKFNNAKLRRVKGKREREECVGNPVDEDSCRTKRRVTEREKNLCIFCDTSRSEPLPEFSTFNSNRSINKMATEMNDMEMLVKISGSDLVALEAKYHFHCLSRYRNRHRAHMRSLKGASKLNFFEKRAKARAFAELVSFINSALEEGNYVFKLVELHELYESRLRQFGADISVHKMAFKQFKFNFFRYKTNALKHGIMQIGGLTDCQCC